MKTRFLSALFLAVSFCFPAVASDALPVQAVASVDLTRYVGTWHEIARYPMFFQRKCIGDVTANYSVMENGKLKVLNRCRTENGEFIEADGSARVVENSQNAKLKVSFFWPFSADYWVIGLDPEYRWALVGNPKRDYLWVLARSKNLSLDDFNAAKAIAQAQGFDVQKLILSEAKSSTP